MSDSDEEKWNSDDDWDINAGCTKREAKKRRAADPAKKCAMPRGCTNETHNHGSMDHSSVRCWTCKNTFCPSCTKELWLTAWTPEIFAKPKMSMPGLEHSVFQCPICSSAFDRFTPM